MRLLEYLDTLLPVRERLLTPEPLKSRPLAAEIQKLNLRLHRAKEGALSCEKAIKFLRLPETHPAWAYKNKNIVSRT